MEKKTYIKPELLAIEIGYTQALMAASIVGGNIFIDEPADPSLPSLAPGVTITIPGLEHIPGIEP